MSWIAHAEALADHVEGQCAGDRRFAFWVQAEDTDFVRFTRGRVRQPGTVRQASATLRWVVGDRHAEAEVTLSGDRAEDVRRLDRLVGELDALVPRLPPDPHLMLPDGVEHTVEDDGGTAPDAAQVVQDVVEAAGEADLVGIYAGGAVHRVFRNELGQRNRFTRHGFLLDWCLVHSRDKATQARLGADVWSREALEAEMRAAREDLEALARPPVTLAPGRYRAWLGPRALAELLGLVGMDAFSAKALHEKRSPLAALADGRQQLDPRVHLAEDLLGGTAPRFGKEGFVMPERVDLVQAGRHAGALVSPRAARELGLDTTGAGVWEQPVALALAAGDLPTPEARAALGTGLWVPDLWYVNHADRNAARLTGMTRFATLWVEDGEVVGPVEPMRFDDTLYGLLGDRLERLGQEQVLLPSTSTYGSRSTDSVRTPGVLVAGLELTL